MSNIETCFFPPNTARRLASALMFLLFTVSWSLFFLIYSHNFLVISVLGSGLLPTTLASASLGFMAFINAGLGVLFFFTTFFGAAAFLAGFFATVFLTTFFAATVFLTGFLDVVFPFTAIILLLKLSDIETCSLSA